MTDSKSQHKQVDGWIEKLNKCQHLSESEVKELVVKVHIIFRFAIVCSSISGCFSVCSFGVVMLIGCSLSGPRSVGAWLQCRTRELPRCSLR